MTKEKEEIKEIPTEETLAYKEEYARGVKAFQDGKTEDECPRPKGDNRRTWWYNGYFTERTGVRLAGVFKRKGITWP
jgi:ribosome modulation factor